MALRASELISLVAVKKSTACLLNLLSWAMRSAISLAARALGIKQRNIMIWHILPNVFNLIIVNITLGYASALLLEAGLSFLGFGVQEPTPSWGNMLTTAQESTVIQFFWWRWIIPALFVVGAALSINLLGDALREAMDPRSNER